MKTACLNLRTENSLDTGIAPTTALLDRAREFRINAVARADRNSLLGMETFLREARQRSLQAVAGVELDLASGPEDGGAPDGRDRASRSLFPIVLYAAGDAGLDNLARLVSSAHRRVSVLAGVPAKAAVYPHGQRLAGRPFITLHDLEQHHSGLIAQSPGLTGEVPIRILRNELDLAERLANRLAGVFGRSSFYLGLSSYGRPLEARLCSEITAMAARLGLPTVLANEIDHLDPADAPARDLRSAIAAGISVQDGPESIVAGPASHFRSPSELARLFRDHPEALENAVELAERCGRHEPALRYPHFPLPAGRTEAAYLASLCARERNDDPVRRERLDRELGLIAEHELAGYFLILWDLTRHARATHVPLGPGGGPVTSSLVAWQLGITGIDPVAHGLAFEHFLAESAGGPPEFRIEVAASRRAGLVAWLEQRHGATRVARAGQVEVFTPKRAVQEAGDALGLEPAEVNDVVERISNRPGADLSLVVAQDSRLARRYRQDERVRTWLNLARRLQGLPRQYSPHPTGLIVSAHGSAADLPIERAGDGGPVAQISWSDAPSLGLLRIDLPGRNDLTAPETGARQAALFDTTSRIAGTLSSHAETIRRLGRGGPRRPRDMSRFLEKMRPETFDDLVAAFSLRSLAWSGRDLRDLYLARRAGDEEFHLDNPALEKVLGRTEGLLLDQEQVVELAQECAGFDPAQAEELRRVICGSGLDDAGVPQAGTSGGMGTAAALAGWRSRFLGGAVRSGFSPERAAEIFMGLVNAGRAAPPRARSVAEAVRLFQKSYMSTFSAGPELVKTAARRTRPTFSRQIAMPWATAPDATGWNYRHTGTDGAR